MTKKKSHKNIDDFIVVKQLCVQTPATENQSEILHDVKIVKKGFFIVMLDETTDVPQDTDMPNNTMFLKEEAHSKVSAYWKGSDKKILDLKDHKDILDRFPKKGESLKKIVDETFVKRIAELYGCPLPFKLKHSYQWYQKTSAPDHDFIPNYIEVFTSEYKRLIYSEAHIKNRGSEDEKNKYVLSQEVTGTILFDLCRERYKLNNIESLRSEFTKGEITGLGFTVFLAWLTAEIDLNPKNIMVHIQDGKLDKEPEKKLVNFDSGCSLLFSDKKINLPLAGRRVFVLSEPPEKIDNYLDSYLFIKHPQKIYYVNENKKTASMEIQNWLLFNELVMAIKKEDELIPLQENKNLTPVNKYLKIARELIVINSYEGHGNSSLKTFFLTAKGIDCLPFIEAGEEHNWYNWLNLIKENVICKQDLLDNDISDNIFFRREVNQAILRVLTLPEILLKSFVLAYAENEEQETHFMTILLKRTAELKGAALLNSSFKKYLLSKEAKKELEQYLDDYLLPFKTTGKHRLVVSPEEMKKNVFIIFDELCSSVTLSKYFVEQGTTKVQDKPFNLSNFFVPCKTSDWLNDTEDSLQDSCFTIVGQEKFEEKKEEPKKFGVRRPKINPFIDDKIETVEMQSCSVVNTTVNDSDDLSSIPTPKASPTFK